MRRFVLCAVLLLMGRPAFGQVALTWKWKEGETFYVETVSKVKQTMLVEDPRSDGKAPRTVANDREIRQEFEHTLLLSYSVRKVDKDGTAVVAQKVERVAVKAIKTAKAVKDGDAAKKDKDGDVTKEDDALVGTELILHVSPAGAVTRVEGQKKLLAKLTGKDTEKEALLAGALSEASLKRAATQSLGFLPAKGVRPGDTWKRAVELDLGALGRLKVENDYKYEGEDRIAFTSAIKSFEAGKSPSPAYRVERGTFKTTEGKGSLEFNAAAGRLVGSTTSHKFQGDLTIKNVDSVYRTHLTQEQSVVTKVMDRRPAKEVK